MLTIRSCWRGLWSLALVASTSQAAIDPSKSLFERVSESYQSVSNGVVFYYYTQEDRLQILTELFHSLELDYASLFLKQKALHLDLETIRKDALQTEQSITDPTDSFAQAAANLSFLDRAKKIGALFEDSHLHVKARQRLSAISLPILIRKVQGKYLVVSRLKKILSYLALKDDAFSQLALGDELISIDGISPEQAAQKLLPYVHASSALARELWSVEALTLRAFAFPEQAFTDIHFRKSNGSLLRLRFPWFYDSSRRADQALVFQERRFMRSDLLKLSWDDKAKKWQHRENTMENANVASSLPALLSEQNYVDIENEEPALKMGYLIRNGKAYGVLQLSTFNAESVKVPDSEDPAIPYMKPIRDFIKTLKAGSMPLVLDLRNNPGGDGNYPAQLLSLISANDQNYAGISWAFRITRNSLELLDEQLTNDIFAQVLKGIGKEDLMRIFVHAIQNGDTYTAAFSKGDIQADAEVGGYAQKAVALISPDCISACDIAAALLKRSGRVSLMGQPTNGTGAGFNSVDHIVDSEWSDSKRVLKTSIPNQLFGLPGGPAGTYIFPGQAETLNIEGHPIRPDIVYEETVDDLFSESSGWLSKAIEALEP